MNLVEKQVIELLNGAMHGYSVDLKDKVDWNKIIEEGRAHKVEGLLYLAVNKESSKKIDKDLLDRWKLTTFQTGINQIQHIKKISEILNEFNKQDIPVLVLKGLVIRDLYPRPELRTMCDADLLVYKDDLDKAEKLLINQGYRVLENSEEMHRAYYKNGTLVEVHWVITNERYFEGIPQIEESIWKNAVEVNIGDSKALSMNDEDMAVHLCLHMATHLINRGFGIRQICDLVLLIEQRGYLINWDSFLEKIRLCNIETFTKVIFLICESLFNVEIPTQLRGNIKSSIVDDLIEDIFSNGVHGKRNEAAAMAKQMAYDKDFTSEAEISVYRRYFNALFPKVYTMSYKFDYAKKYKILTPIAWIHHFCVWAFSSDYAIKDKMKFATSAMSISQKRNNLIKKLEL